MKKPLWLFLDFDNTLMATEQFSLPSLIARFNRLYGEQIDHELTEEEFNQHFRGQARQTLCDNLGRHFNISVDYPTLYHERDHQIMQHYKTLPQGIPLAPYLIETLTQLATQSVRFALVSNNSVQRALAAMRYAQNNQGALLARFFETHFFEAGEQQKPKPDVYLRAREQMNAPIERCIAVEDSPTGATAAVAAGMKTYGYTGLNKNSELIKSQLLQAGCVVTFDDWRDFPLFLRCHTL